MKKKSVSINRAFVCFFFILLSYVFSAYADDSPSGVKLCMESESEITQEHLLVLQNSGILARPSESLTNFLTRIQNSPLVMYPERSCGRLSADNQNLAYEKAAKTFARVTQEYRDYVLKIQEKEKRDLQRDHECAQQIQMLGKTMSFKEMKAEYFSKNIPGATPTECAKMAGEVIPFYQKRLSLLRIYLAIATGRTQVGQPLNHDRPFSDEFVQKAVPTLWSLSKEKLAPLTEDERKSANRVIEQKKIDQKEAAFRYYYLLSMHPNLVFFNEFINADNFAEMLSAFKRQTEKQEEAYRKSANKETVFENEAYLDGFMKKKVAELNEKQSKALDKVKAKRQKELEIGNICQVIFHFQKNAHISQNELPRVLFLFSLLVGGVGLKAGKVVINTSESLLIKGTKYITKTGSYSVSGFMAFQALTTFEKYRMGQRICSSSAQNRGKVEKGEDETLCNFLEFESYYVEAQNNAISSVATAAIGAGTMWGAAKVYNKVKRLKKSVAENLSEAL